MKVVRVEVLWNEIEPNGPGRYSPTVLAATDHLFAAAAARHLKVLLIMDSTPCWASSAPSSLTKGCKKRSVGDFVAWPPTHPADFAHVAAFMAGRYRKQLEAFEVWNEPDQANQLYFAGPNKPQRYAAILRAAYPAIKAAAPNVPVLAGALVGWNGAFLKALYAAGIKGYYDGLSVHYYDLVLADLRAIHQVQRPNGDTKPLWLAEFGWSSCAPARSQEGPAVREPDDRGAEPRRHRPRNPHDAVHQGDVRLLDGRHDVYSLGLVDRNCGRSPPSTRCTRSSRRASRPSRGRRRSPSTARMAVRSSSGAGRPATSTR